MEQIPDLTGKVAIVTGANSGIGLWTTIGLAVKGARVFMACRNQAKAEEAMEQVRKEIQAQWEEEEEEEEEKEVESSRPRPRPRPKLDFLPLDLSSVKSCHEAAANFLAKGLPLHILINNGGAHPPYFGLNTEGVEETFATNHLGSFAHEFATSFDLAGVSDSEAAMNIGIDHHMRYARSKVCNIAFTQALARRLAVEGGERVFVNAVHPGLVKTHLSDNITVALGSIAGGVFEWVLRHFGLQPREGCLTTLYCATSVEVEKKDYRGLYFIPTAVMLPPSALASDHDFQDKVWKFSIDLVQEIMANCSSPATGLTEE
ncbi:hypothetical protein BGZ94_006740 [Podila epigama]|nr:hypothetical protein BGZ94_006740 [Podila epigama]